LGTNTGLKRVQLDATHTSYRDLLYTRRRFLTRDHLRVAITAVFNHTFHARQPQIWGEGTTA
jgi:TnpA family transposase